MVTKTEIAHFQYWALLMVFSIVNFVNIYYIIDDWEERTTELRWVFAVPVFTFIEAFLAFSAHMFLDWYRGSMWEHFCVLVCFVLWAAVLPTMMDETNTYTRFGDGLAYMKGNVYFSGWLCFIMTIMLATSHAQVNFERQDQETWFHWSGFAFSSLVVLSASAAYWKDMCESVDDSDTCARSMFGIVLGVFSALIGFAMMFQNDPRTEKYTSFLLMFAWSFLVGYVTYDVGPGSHVGTLYFSSWICFILTLWVAVKSMRVWFANNWEDATPAAGDATPEVEAKEGGDDAKAVEGEVEEVEETAAV
jgi:hypothetical protein